VTAVGAGADALLTTTGYFAQAVNPTSNAITVSTRIVDFSMPILLVLLSALWPGWRAQAVPGP
jgi:hypothetical protein